MSKNWITGRSLGAITGAIVVAFVVVTGVLSSLFFFTSSNASRSISRQHELLESYMTAIALGDALDELRYRGSDLANSLSDEAYNAFIVADKNVAVLSAKIQDAEFAGFVRESRDILYSHSLEAMDQYLVDDRRAGDQLMMVARQASQDLHTQMASRLTALEAELAAEGGALLRTNQAAGSVTTGATFIALVISASLGFLMFRVIINPIRRMISAISQAAKDTSNADAYKIDLQSDNEIGDAVKALNRLLDSIVWALDEVRAKTLIAEISETRWKALFGGSPDAIVLVDAHSTEIIESNPATMKLLCMGDSPDEKITAYDVHKHEVPRLQAFFDDILAGGSACCDTLSCNTPDRLVPVSVVGVTVPHEGDQAILLYIRDMTVHFEQEKKLKAANEAKTNFLANMSHEIRTPLNGILGMAQGLKAQSLARVQNDMVATIADCGATLMAILNDVLDISKAEVEKLTIVPADGDFHYTMSSVSKLFAPTAEEAGVNFTLELDPALPAQLHFDRVRVRQCLSNLISNALKFTDEGSVIVKVKREAEENGEGIVLIEVHDTGIGMSEEMLGKLFTPFTQAEESSSRSYGGTGLGLAISRRLARLMGGDVTAVSELDVGSVFTLTFKAALANSAGRTLPAGAVEKPEGSLADIRVLLVDDNIVNRQVVRVFLQPRNIKVTEAENGRLALDKLEQEEFDIVLLDIHMPVMDGIETIKCIRESEAPWRSLPVVALTADAMSGDRERYIEMGMNDYVSKPVDQATLLSTIAHALGRDRDENAAIVAKSDTGKTATVASPQIGAATG